jgi:hypothetical protein
MADTIALSKVLDRSRSLGRVRQAQKHQGPRRRSISAADNLSCLPGPIAQKKKETEINFNSATVFSSALCSYLHRDAQIMQVSSSFMRVIRGYRNGHLLLAS